jgi:hypothetical protein
VEKLAKTAWGEAQCKVYDARDVQCKWSTTEDFETMPLLLSYTAGMPQPHTEENMLHQDQELVRLKTLWLDERAPKEIARPYQRRACKRCVDVIVSSLHKKNRRIIELRLDQMKEMDLSGKSSKLLDIKEMCTLSEVMQFRHHNAMQVANAKQNCLPLVRIENPEVRKRMQH